MGKNDVVKRKALKKIFGNGSPSTKKVWYSEGNDKFKNGGFCCSTFEIFLKKIRNSYKIVE